MSGFVNLGLGGLCLVFGIMMIAVVLTTTDEQAKDMIFVFILDIILCLGGGALLIAAYIRGVKEPFYHCVNCGNKWTSRGETFKQKRHAEKEMKAQAKQCPTCKKSLGNAKKYYLNELTGQKTEIPFFVTSTGWAIGMLAFAILLVVLGILSLISLGSGMGGYAFICTGLITSVQSIRTFLINSQHEAEKQVIEYTCSHCLTVWNASDRSIVSGPKVSVQAAEPPVLSEPTPTDPAEIQKPIANASQPVKMTRGKAYKNCLTTTLGAALFVGIIGWLLITIFPKTTTAVSTIGGIMVVITLWGAIDGLFKDLKSANEVTSPITEPPTMAEGNISAAKTPTRPESSVSSTPETISNTAFVPPHSSVPPIPVEKPNIPIIKVFSEPKPPIESQKRAPQEPSLKKNRIIGYVLLGIVGLIVLGIVIMRLAGPAFQGAVLTPTSTLTATVMPIPTQTSTPPPTPTLAPTPVPYVIKDAAFLISDDTDCTMDAIINSVNGDQFELTFKKDSMLGVGLFCNGAKHTWEGTQTYADYIFISDEIDPLQFTVERGRGYVYLQGNGFLVLPDGAQITLPHETSESAAIEYLPSGTIFMDDFSTSFFDGYFNSDLWSLFDGVKYTRVEQNNGIMSFFKLFPSGGENGKLRSLQTWTLGEFSGAQAEMRLDAPTDGQMGNMVMAFEAVNPVVRRATWWTGCGIGLTYSNPYFWCAQESDEAYPFDHESPQISLEYGKWYTIRIDFNATTGEITYSLDGNVIDKWQPDYADKLLDNRFSINIGTWEQDGTSITAYMDNVQIFKR